MHESGTGRRRSLWRRDQLCSVCDKREKTALTGSCQTHHISRRRLGRTVAQDVFYLQKNSWPSGLYAWGGSTTALGRADQSSTRADISHESSQQHSSTAALGAAGVSRHALGYLGQGTPIRRSSFKDSVCQGHTACVRLFRTRNPY